MTEEEYEEAFTFIAERIVDAEDEQREFDDLTKAMQGNPAAAPVMMRRPRRT